MGTSRPGLALLRAITILIATCLSGCGDPGATDGSQSAQVELAFTNEGHNLCTLPQQWPKCCSGGTGDQYCTFLVTGSFKLDKTCRYRGRLKIAQSNTTLDCDGAILEGEHAVAAGGLPDEDNIGIRIESESNSENELACESESSFVPQNITVKNCNLQNFFHGITVANPASSDYTKSPTNVRLENVHVKNSGNTGIHIYKNVEGVVITNSRVENSSGPGIHLSYSSQKTRVELSRLFKNGRRAPQGVPGDATPREGLTIDGSSDNEIVYNEFDQNAAGGIFLYSNCGEKGSEQRPPALNNLIFRNTFKGSPRGIWVASRQSDDLRRFACDPSHDLDEPEETWATPYGFDQNDYPPNCDEPTTAAQCAWTTAFPATPNCSCVTASCPFVFRCPGAQKTGAFFADFVKDTTISKNIFYPLVAYDKNGDGDLEDADDIAPHTTVQVEDDGTTISKNAFVEYKSGTELIRIGTPFRFLHHGLPVTRTVVDGNGYLDMSRTTFDAHVKYEYGSQPTLFNTAPTRTEQACRQGDKVVPPHSSDTFYLAATGTVCQSQERSCRNGVLSGTYTHPSCTVQ